MNSLMILILASIVIQFLVERVKDFFPSSIYEKVTKYVKPSVFSLVFSLIIAFGCKIDLFALLNFAIEPVWLSYILTAITLSGGSVALNELIKSLASIKDYNNSIADITYGALETSQSDTDKVFNENENNSIDQNQSN